MFLIISKYFIPKGYQGVTVFPFVILKEKLQKDDLVLINHEKIHLRQQSELLVLPFFVWYFVEFMIRWFVYKDRNKAYRNVSFEREAYAYESDLGYLKTNSFWSFIRFL